MLRRVPLKDGKPLSIETLSSDLTIYKPFKAPSSAIKLDRALPPRKRKRVSYKENGGADEDDEDDGKRKRKKSKSKDDDWDSDEGPRPVKTYPVFKATPLEQTSKRFSIPVMTNSKGEVVRLTMTHASLGIRPPVILLPRPLHDPMADHAIVLYDPTIDERETDEERKEREAEEQKEAARKEAAAGMEGLFNPHKSLKELLGERDTKKKEQSKVPVVIDPILTKVLRPHQVEGVKVNPAVANEPRTNHVSLSSYTSVPQG